MVAAASVTVKMSDSIVVSVVHVLYSFLSSFGFFYFEVLAIHVHEV